MRESVWSYAVIFLGVTAIIIIWFFGNITRTDQHDYNLLKETTEAAMLDAIDIAQYRKDGTIKIDSKTFVSKFTKRFAENADLSNTYKIEVFDINETPPKVSIKVSTKNNTANYQNYNFNLTNNIDAILESKYPYCLLIEDANNDGLSTGDRYLCDVGNGKNYEFYYFDPNNRTSGKKYALMLMSNNICEDGTLASDGKENCTSSYSTTKWVEPDIIAEYIRSATKDWNHIPIFEAKTTSGTDVTKYKIKAFPIFSGELTYSVVDGKYDVFEQYKNILCQNLNDSYAKNYWLSGNWGIGIDGGCHIIGELDKQVNEAGVRLTIQVPLHYLEQK